METLIVLGVVLIVGIPVAVIYLLFANAKLKTRVNVLEAVVARNLPIRAADMAPVQETPRPEPRSPEPSSVPAEAPSPWEVTAPVASEPESPEPVPAASVQPEGPPRAVVLNAEKMAALVSWMMQNWFYVVSAISLALAGIFLVQYGIEKGLLPPWLRVTFALAFGVVLVAAGEFIRRRFGDSEDSSTAYLPSTFSGAGIVTLFGAVLAARTLYGLIGAEVALIGMALVGAVAVVLGWFYGPLMAAIGITGAMAAPFLVGGSSEDPSWLLIYFAFITIAGLAIDTVQRWAWVSIISLVLGFGAGFMLVLESAQMTEPFFVMYCAVLALAAIAIPIRRLVPDHGGTLLSMRFLSKHGDAPWPEFPTRVAGGALLAASALILFAAFETSRTDTFWTAVIVLSGLALALLMWARNAEALTDLVAFPALALLLVASGGWRIWAVEARAALEPEANLPLMPTVLVGIGILISVAAGWRSLHRRKARNFTAAGAALFAPAMAILIEVSWPPAPVIGNYVWALHAMAIAALMVFLAERFSRADGPEDRLRVSMAMLSALAAIAFGLVLLFSYAALTLALAITVVGAAWLDRQFNLPLMGLYILAGVATVGYRLVIDPGLNWAESAPLWELLLSHGGALVSFAAAWWLSKLADRERSAVLLESAVFSTTGILASLLIYRAILGMGGYSAVESHWNFGIGATIWIALGLTQLRRLSMGGALKVLRKILAAVFMLIGVGQLVVAVTIFNPLLYFVRDGVLGPPLVNTLMPAYLLPAFVLYFGARWLRDMPRTLRIGLNVLAIALSTLWLGLVIRHFWRGGADMALPGIEQPELYSYTVALLIVGAVLFYRSLSEGSAFLRKAGLFVIGLAVAKVFLIDISGLGGLIRVFSLLFLGLSLAGLAWLNRWATGQGSGERDAD